MNGEGVNGEDINTEHHDEGIFDLNENEMISIGSGSGGNGDGDGLSHSTILTVTDGADEVSLDDDAFLLPPPPSPQNGPTSAMAIAETLEDMEFGDFQVPMEEGNEDMGSGDDQQCDGMRNDEQRNDEMECKAEKEG